MKTRLIFFTITLLLLDLACDEKKKEITQVLCEGITNRTDCEAAGCTYTCGMVFLKTQLDGGSAECVARRKVGRCLAAVKKVTGKVNNDNDVYTGVSANSIGWIPSGSEYSVQNNTTLRYRSYIKVNNTLPYPIEVLGYEAPTWPADSEDHDPCTSFDPDGTLFPWEGSCEADWWSEDLWDDVLPE